MPATRSSAGMIGRKVGMMRLYDGSGHARGVTAIELGPNYVTQVRTPERDGYTAVQLGFPGKRKRVNRPERGHLRTSGLEGRAPALTRLQEFRVTDVSGYQPGQELTVDQFEPGTFVDVTATSKGRGFQGGVKRHNFAGGPKTHGQSDRHRAPGSIGSGTTPGRVYKGLKMAGHMGAETVSVLNLLVVAVDPSRNLIFVEGSVPGAREGAVTVALARRPALKDYTPPVIPAAGEERTAEVDDEPVAEEPAAEEVTAEAEPEVGGEAEDAPVAEAETEDAPEVAAEAEAPAAEAAGDDSDESQKQGEAQA